MNAGAEDVERVPEDLCAAIRSARRVQLVGHVRPDPDTLGAMTALAVALPELNITPYLSLPPDTLSRRLRFLPELAGQRPAAESDLASCDCVVVLDTAKERRVNVAGGFERIRDRSIINVDHHPTNTRFGRWNWVDSARSSTSEMTCELIRALGCQVTPTIATLLYAGIHSDTQGFSLVNTTPRALAVAHELAAAGARIEEVCERLHRSRSRSDFELLKLVFSNTRISLDGRLGWSVISLEELARIEATADDIDDQVEVVRSVEGVQLAILFTESEPGKVRTNFRGERGVSVMELAREFGGGGHRQAAGAMIDGRLGEVVERVVAVAEQALNARLS